MRSWRPNCREFSSRRGLLTSAGVEMISELSALTRGRLRVSLLGSSAGRTPTVAELHALLCDETRGPVVGYLAGVEPIPAEVLSAAPSLRVISRNGVGTDAVDTSAAAAAGIAVEIARGSKAAQGVAELAILHILASLRFLGSGIDSVRQGGWDRTRGRELAGRTVGVVGLGAIGRTVATIATAVGATVIASDPFITESDLVRLVSPTELFATADVVTLHSPPAERPLVDAGVLAMMREGSVLVNTARSALVDGGAVLEALESGRLAAYAIDAFDSEPPVLDHLLRHPRCFPTPHLGGFTDESVHRATTFAVDNLLRVLSAGQTPER